MAHPDPLFAQAEAAIAKALGIETDKVSIQVGEDKEGMHGIIMASELGADRRTRLVFTISKPGIDLDREVVEKQILEVMGRFPALKAIAQTVPDETLATSMLTDLKAAVAGTDFDQRLLQWPGFDSEVAKQGNWNLGDYAIRPSWDDISYSELSITIPEGKDTDITALKEQVTANIRERLPAIKQTLGERVAKYIRQNMEKATKPEAEIVAALEKAAQQMQTLTIDIIKNKYGMMGGGIDIRLQSPEQKQHNEKTGKEKHLDAEKNSDALVASNPLNLLSRAPDKSEKDDPDHSPQQSKALGRSFLFAGDKAMDIFPLIAGRRDIRNAIGKELARISQAHPDKKPVFDKILNSDLFKIHGYGGKGADPSAVAPSTPVFIKDLKVTDQIEASINLPLSKVRETIEGLVKGPQAEIPQTVPASMPAQPQTPPALAQPASDAISISDKPSHANVFTITISRGGTAAPLPIAADKAMI